MAGPALSMVGSIGRGAGIGALSNGVSNMCVTTIDYLAEHGNLNGALDDIAMSGFSGALSGGIMGGIMGGFQFKMTYTKLSEVEVSQILSDRGLDNLAIRDMIDSFDGPIYARQGNPREVFTITESSLGDASGVFVTRGSAGTTPADRINNLALPPNNTAVVERTVQLTRTQLLLEWKVAGQGEWALIANDGILRTGGGWQVITDGRKYTGAIK